MQYIVCDNEIMLSGIADFDPVKIFECGQCFRWNADKHGVYTGIAMGHALSVRSAGDRIFLGCSEDDFHKVWYDYFDLNRDYEAIRRSLPRDPYTTAAAEFGKGIRILNQDKWETLCSFVISQCNNIPRIKKIIESFCSLFGDPFEYSGKLLYTFPSVNMTASLSEKDLEPIRCGYRAPYILEAARALSSGALDLDALSSSGFQYALESLKTIKGIGDKVANCVLLFGLHIPGAFPIDTWVRQALKAHYPNGFDPSLFGEAAGIAQQYIFYYARSGNL